MKLLIRLLTAVLGIVALLLVALLWMNPDGNAQTLGLTPNGPVGRAALRADLAGLFLALGIFSLTAAAYQQAAAAKTALILTATVLVGRVINLAASGMAPALLPPVALEVVMIAVYYAGARVWATGKTRVS